MKTAERPPRVVKHRRANGPNPDSGLLECLKAKWSFEHPNATAKEYTAAVIEIESRLRHSAP